MKILGLIPARGGSKGVPNKNIKVLSSKPLIVYSIAAGLESEALTKLVVSTDSAAIAEVSKQYGAAVPFIRPSALATDSSPSIDTVIHAVEYFQERDVLFDAVCLLQPTCPFRTKADIQAAIQTFTKSGADSLISVREVPHEFNPHWVFEANEAGLLRIATGESEIITRRQALPKAYHRDGAIYLVKTEVLLEKRSLYGAQIAYHLSQNPVHVNIDTMEDWAIAERTFLQLKNGAHE